MKDKSIRRIVVLIVIGLMLASCSGGPPGINFIRPPDGSVVLLSSTHNGPNGIGSVSLEIHTNSHTNITVSMNITLNFYDNGSRFFTQSMTLDPSSDAPWGGVTIPWTPHSLGDHTIRAQVIYPGGDLEASENVCVVNDPANPIPNLPTGTTNFCTSVEAQELRAAITPTNTPIPVIDSVQGYPSPIYYGATCPSVSTVTFRTALTLPDGVTPDLLTVEAHVNVIMGSSATNSGHLLVTLLPTGTWDASTGGQIFAGTLSLGQSYNDANNQLNLASLNGDSGALQYYVDVSRHDPSYQSSTMLGRSLDQVISLSPCPTASIPQPHSSNKGSSGAPATGCAQYTNEVSCNLGGCTWNTHTASCGLTQ